MIQQTVDVPGLRFGTDGSSRWLFLLAFSSRHGWVFLSLVLDARFSIRRRSLWEVSV